MNPRSWKARSGKLKYIREWRSEPVKIRLLKLIDKVVGAFLLFILQSQRPVPFSHRESFLIIRPGGIGDAVLLIPTIRALRKAYPQSKIDLLVEKRNAAVFPLCLEVDRVYCYDAWKDLITTIRRDYDVVLDTEQWHRLSAIVARLTNSPVFIGLATNERKKLFTHPVEYSQDEHEVFNFLNLLRPIVDYVEFDIAFPFLRVPDELTRKTRTLLSPISDRRIITLFPGGSVLERRWGGDRFHQVAKMLNERGFGIVVVGNKDDIQDGEKITREIPYSINFCGKLLLPETAAVMKEAVLLITGDSGIMHIGYGLGIKIVALFGPGREKKWAPRE